MRGAKYVPTVSAVVFAEEEVERCAAGWGVAGWRCVVRL